MSEQSKKLMKMMEDIEAAEKEESKISGSIETIMDNLKSEYGIKSIDHAEKELKKMDDKVADLEEEINLGLEALTKEFNL